MKKLFAFLLLLFTALVFVGCKDDEVKLSIKVDGSTSLTLNVGEEFKIKAALEQSDVSDLKLNFKSDNESVATVSSEGVVKAVKMGNAKITISANIDPKVTAEVSVLVKGPEVLPTSIEIESPNEVEVGKTIDFKATVLPDNATTKAVVWSSSDETIATIDDYGKLTGKKVGEVTITCKAKGDEKVTASKKVTVKEAQGTGLESIKLTGAKNYLVLGTEFALEVVYIPDTFLNKEVVWTSSNEEVATVVNGIVTPVAKGSCKITCTSKADEKVSASVSFDVIEEDLVIEDFTLKCDEEVFYDNDSYKINYEVTSKPTATATPKTQFTWTSSNEEVVKVGSKGELTTIKVGTATITAVEEISGIEKALEITVIESPALEGMTIVGREITTEENVTLAIQANPAHANYDVEWESLNKDIATINDKGYVQPLKAGEVKFTAKDKTTGIVAEYTLVIKKAFDPSAGPDSIQINYGGKNEIYIGYEIRLSVDVTPAGVSSAVEWELHASSKGFAEISQEGVLKALSEGVARVRAVSKVNGKKSSYVTFNIVKKPEPKPIPNLNGYEIILMNAASALHELDPFYSNGAIQYVGADKPYKQKAWRAVEEEYNCKIVVKAYPDTAPWGQQRVKWLIDNATNGTTECDFGVVSGAWINKLAGGNAAVDTSRFFDLYGMNQVEEALYEVGSSGGKYRCVSAGLNTSRTYVIKGLFYNYGLIKKLGLESPAKLFNEGKWTYDDFVKYCADAQVVLPENSYAVSGGPSIIWAGMVNSAGIKLADKQKMEINITHKYSLEALAALKKINEGKGWSINEIGYDEANVPFREGRAIFSPGEYWFLKAENRYPKYMWGDSTEYGYVPFPYPASVSKEDTKVNFSGESVLMMVEGKKYPTGVDQEGIYRAVQDMYLRTMDEMKNDPLFDAEQKKRDSLKARVDDPESIEATIFYIGARTIFDPMFDESFQTEYSGDLTTAVINSVKGNDSKQELDSVYSKVLDSFVRTYGG